MKFYDRSKRVEFAPNGKLRFLQNNRWGNQVNNLGLCDVAECVGQAVAYYADENRKGFLLCHTHKQDAEADGLLLATEVVHV